MIIISSRQERRQHCMLKTCPKRKKKISKNDQYCLKYDVIMWSHTTLSLQGPKQLSVWNLIQDKIYKNCENVLKHKYVRP